MTGPSAGYFCATAPGEKELDLTPRSFRLLHYLAGWAGTVCERNVILDEVWGYDYIGETRTLDVPVHWLRDKLRAAGADVHIETVRGVGYRLVVRDE